MIPKDAKYKLIHKDGCGGVAWYQTKKFDVGDILLASAIIMLNGKHPQPDTLALCGNCKKPVIPTLEAQVKI